MQGVSTGKTAESIVVIPERSFKDSINLWTHCIFVLVEKKARNKTIKSRAVHTLHILYSWYGVDQKSDPKRVAPSMQDVQMRHLTRFQDFQLQEE